MEISNPPADNKNKSTNRFTSAVQRYFDNCSNLINGQDKLLSRTHSDAVSITKDYYDVATDFYEWGWGQSFHFAPRLKGETLKESIKRHEILFAKKLELNPSSQVLDIGCGVGGPMMTISKETGANITGINISDYQIKKGNKYLKQNNLTNKCRFLKADYLKIPVEDSSYDAAYAFESICHTPKKDLAYREIFRALKPGGKVMLQEWCLTPEYDPKNPRHVQIREDIEFRNGIAELIHYEKILDMLKEIGFEVQFKQDMGLVDNVPWYAPLGGGVSVEKSRSTSIDRWFTEKGSALLEFLRIVPKGTSTAAKSLGIGADALVDSGKLGIFTPLYCILAVKPK